MPLELMKSQIFKSLYMIEIIITIEQQLEISHQMQFAL